MKKILIALWILTLAMACSPRSTPAPASTTTSNSPVPVAPPLTVDELMNAQVATTTLTDQPLTYQLQDGAFQKDANGGPGFTDIRLLDKMAFGDLNGDQAGDAVAFLSENYGGTGEFISMIVFLNHDGQPAQAAFEPIEDRAVIRSVSVDAAIIALEAVIHGVNDPMCCASLESMRHYKFDHEKLDMLDFATQTPDGRWRNIEITAPQNDESVSGSLRVTGNVAIAPFENTLVYHILDANGAELTAGPVTVIAADMGAPGTFDTTIDLSSLPTSAERIRIEIQDQSAADGSLLAMDSVNLIVK